MRSGRYAARFILCFVLTAGVVGVVLAGYGLVALAGLRHFFDWDGSAIGLIALLTIAFGAGFAVAYLDFLERHRFD